MILDLPDEEFGNTSTTIPPGASETFPTTHLKILDLCTGTGCIPLLLHALLSSRVSHLEAVGVDISPAALALAKQNLHHNITEGHLPLAASSQIQFVQGDIFGDKALVEGEWDIVTSNPPYISPKGFNTTTSRSVRNYEPKSALVPPSPSGDHADLLLDEATGDSAIGDSFYPAILEIAARVKARMVIMEVADLPQARRVASLGIRSGNWRRCEIWRDWFDEVEMEEGKEEEEEEEDKSTIHISGVPVRVLGKGNGRSVYFSS